MMEKRLWRGLFSCLWLAALMCAMSASRASAAGDVFKGGMIRVSLRGVIEYDDNVFGAPDNASKEDSWRTVLKGRISLNTSSESLYASLIYEPAYSAFTDISQEDFVQDLNAMVRYNVSERLKVALKEHFIDNKFSDLGDVLDVRDSNDEYTYNRAMLDFSYYWTPKFSTTVDVGCDYYKYDDFRESLDFERWAVDGTVAASYQLNKRLDLTTRYRYRTVEFDDPEDKDLDTHYGTAGVRWRITERLTADCRAGVNVADSSETGDSVEPAVNAALSSRLSRSTNAKIGVSHAFTETEREYAVASRSSVTGMIDHSFTRKTSAKVVAAYKLFDFEGEDSLAGGEDGDETWIDVSVTVRHALDPERISVFAYYGLTDVSTDFDEGGYTRNRAGLGVVGTF